jgi:FAD/FMN-containing dehydrogenase
VALCYGSGLPITVRGRGANLSGATIPGPGCAAVILDGLLNRNTEVKDRVLYAVAEPGVATARLA